MELDAYLGRLVGFCLGIMGELRFDKSHKLHFTMVALYASLLELANGIALLRSAEACAGVPSLTRTLLETRVEFCNLAADPTYGYYLDVADLTEWLRLADAAADGTNTFLAGMRARPDYEDIVETWRTNLQDLKSQGYRKLQVRERFERAGMLEEYQSVYNVLSADSHSGQRALIARHLDISDAGDFEVAIFKPAGQASYVSLAAAAVIESTETIFRLCGVDLRGRLVPWVREFDALCTSLSEA